MEDGIVNGWYRGFCQSCGEKLVCIDIDPKEMENFAASLTDVACQREAKADFVWFQVRKCVPLLFFY